MRYIHCKARSEPFTGQCAFGLQLQAPASGGLLQAALLLQVAYRSAWSAMLSEARSSRGHLTTFPMGTTDTG